jgi:hypothetical protein
MDPDPTEIEYKLKKVIEYDRVLQELEDEYLIIMTKYLSKLHNAFHADNGLGVSHKDIVNKIKQDCISICLNTLGRIAFDDRSEEEVIKEILEYNYAVADIKHITEVDRLDIYSIADQLNDYCLKRSAPEWFSFGIHELIQNGKVDLGPRGSKRIQFCKLCGEGIYLSSDHIGSKHRSSKKGSSIT